MAIPLALGHGGPLVIIVARFNQGLPAGKKSRKEDYFLGVIILYLVRMLFYFGMGSHDFNFTLSFLGIHWVASLLSLPVQP